MLSQSTEFTWDRLEKNVKALALLAAVLFDVYNKKKN